MKERDVAQGRRSKDERARRMERAQNEKVRERERERERKGREGRETQICKVTADPVLFECKSHASRPALYANARLFSVRGEKSEGSLLLRKLQQQRTRIVGKHHRWRR